MKKNQFDFNLTINDEEVDYITKATSHSNEMHLSIQQLADLLSIEYDDCVNRMGTSSGKIGVFPGSISDPDDSLLTQCLEVFVGYKLVYTWESFSKVFPEAENVDWEKEHALYLETRDKKTKWRNEKFMYILTGDGEEDRYRFELHFKENSIIISWYDFLKKFNYTPHQVVNTSRYCGELRPVYSNIRSSIRTDFVENLRVLVVPSETPVSHISTLGQEWFVTTWTDFLTFFTDAVYVKWDEPGMPLNKQINSI